MDRRLDPDEPIGDQVRGEPVTEPTDQIDRRTAVAGTQFDDPGTVELDMIEEQLIGSRLASPPGDLGRPAEMDVEHRPLELLPRRPGIGDHRRVVDEQPATEVAGLQPLRPAVGGQPERHPSVPASATSDHLPHPTLKGGRMLCRTQWSRRE